MSVKSKSISTTALSKELGISVKETFSKLVDKGYIERQDENWILTEWTW